MTPIQLNDEVIIYKSSLNFDSKFEKNKFIDKLKTIDELVGTLNPKKYTPGRQSSLTDMYIPELNFVKDHISNLISKEFNVSNNFIIKSWVYYSDSDNGYSGYHDHTTLHPKPTNLIEKLRTDYTFTYYVQMPNNLKGDEGKIFFRTKSGYEIGILPEDNDIFIFQGDLEHRPEINPNSNKARIVIAGNVAFFDNYIRKTKKTFL